jgi:NADH-quinone oxidoreductase subunit C
VDTIIDTLKARFPYVAPRPSVDHPAVNVPAANLREFAQGLRDELGYNMLLDLCGVDWDKESPRFGVIYHFYHGDRKTYLRVATLAPDDANPEVPSLAGLYPAADWHEREAYDMMGVRFAGHPNLTRILMWEGYPYHPLRKEFPLAGIETELPAADVAAATKAKVIAAPMMGGPFNAPTEDKFHMSDAEPRAADQSWTENKPKPGQTG